MVPLKPLFPCNSSGVKGKLLFFSLPHAFVQFLAIFVHSAGLGEINLRMNGPRVYWGRGPEPALQLFIIFNRGEIFKGLLPNECFAFTRFGIDCSTWGQFSVAVKFVTASWMAAEKLILARQDKANNRAVNRSKLRLKFIWNSFIWE